MSRMFFCGSGKNCDRCVQRRVCGYSAPALGSAVITAALSRSGLTADDVDEVIFGNVLSAGLGRTWHASGDGSWTARSGRRVHGQQGLRLESQGGHVSRPSDSLRRCQRESWRAARKT